MKGTSSRQRLPCFTESFHTMGVNTSIPKSLNSLYAGCLALHRLRSRMTNHSGRPCTGVWKSFIFQVWASFLILQAVVIHTATSSYKIQAIDFY